MESIHTEISLFVFGRMFMVRIAVCTRQMDDKSETSTAIQKWIKRNTAADAEICPVESVEELQNIMETQPDKYNFCIMDMPALQNAFASQGGQTKHPLLIRGADSIQRIFVEDIMYAENSLRRITYTLYNRKKVVSVRRAGSFEQAVGEIAQIPAFIQPHKSFFVQLKYVSELGTDHIRMADGRKIPVAQSRMMKVQSRYLHYLTERVDA